MTQGNANSGSMNELLARLKTLVTEKSIPQLPDNSQTKGYNALLQEIDAISAADDLQRQKRLPALNAIALPNYSMPMTVVAASSLPSYEADIPIPLKNHSRKLRLVSHPKPEPAPDPDISQDSSKIPSESILALLR